MMAEAAAAAVAAESEAVGRGGGDYERHLPRSISSAVSESLLRDGSARSADASPRHGSRSVFHHLHLVTTPSAALHSVLRASLRLSLSAVHQLHPSPQHATVPPQWNGECR